MTMTARHETRPALGAAGTWHVVPDDSMLTFAIRHLGVATVRGRFTRFRGELERDGLGMRVAGAVRADSVETGNQLRDDRVRGAGFLDAAAHPEIHFASSSIEVTGAGVLVIAGEMTIAAITRPVT